MRILGRFRRILINTMLPSKSRAGRSLRIRLEDVQEITNRDLFNNILSIKFNPTSWAPAVWAGAEGAEVNYTSQNGAVDFRILSVDLHHRTLRAVRL